MNLNTTRKAEKNSTVYTPAKLSKHIFDIVSEEYDFNTLYDPCIGQGGMTKFFKQNGSTIIGSDVDSVGEDYCDIFFHQDIKEHSYDTDVKPSLIIMNPPFNGNGKGKNNLLYPHLFLKTILEEFGEDIPVIMITGDNFLNNNTLHSSRLKYISDGSFNITSIMTLPLNAFEGIKFNTQVLFFNMPKLKPYYIFDIDKVAMNNIHKLPNKQKQPKQIKTKKSLSNKVKNTIAPHVRKGHSRKIGKKNIWIQETVVHSEEFHNNFSKLPIIQHIKYREHFIADSDRNLNLFPFSGSKYKYEKHFHTALADLNPTPVEYFLEPFAGSLGSFTFLNKIIKAKNYVINDNNPKLVNLYQNIKDNPIALIEKIVQLETKYSSLLPTDGGIKKGTVKDSEQKQSMYAARDMHKEVRDSFNEHKLDIDSSASLLFLQARSFNAFYREGAKGQYNNGFNWSNSHSNIENLTNAIIDMHITFQEKNVIIENLDIPDFLKKYAQIDSFIYLDPPYLGSVLKYNKSMFNGSLQDHLTLIKKTKFHKYVLYSNSYHQEFSKGFDGYVDFTRNVEVSGKKTTSKKRREILAYKTNISKVRMNSNAKKVA